MRKILLCTFILLMSVLGSKQVKAQLSPKSLFYRCYRHITQSYPPTDHEHIQKVVSGQLNPIDACLMVLDKAKLVSNSNKRIANVNDQEALNVLRTMQSLHHSWLTNKTFPLGGLGYLNETKDL